MSAGISKQDWEERHMFPDYTDATASDAVAAAFPDLLESDLDVMRDVYMTATQRAAYERIVAAVALQLTAGWHSIHASLPDLDEPVWVDFGNGNYGIFVRSDFDDGWVWCATYGNVSVVDGKWVADDAEFDDDYRPIRWHRLPDLTGTGHPAP